MGAPPQAAGVPPSGYPPQSYPPQQSGYGQAPQGYGQAPPAYGQAPPAYGQAPPAYGQAPGWGAAPGYGQGPMRPQRPHGYKHQRRLMASILLIVGAALAIASIATPWWTSSVTVSGGGQSVTNTEYAYPGSQYQAQCSGSAGLCQVGSSTCSYYGGSGGLCSGSTTNIGNLFGSVNGLMIGAIVLAFICAIMGLLGALAFTFSRIQLILTLIILLAALVLGVVAPIYALGGLPGAISADSTGGCGTGTSPCNSFFGSSCAFLGTPPTGVSDVCSWGAGIGWYLSFVSVAMIAIGLLLFFVSRRDPYTVQEIVQAQQSGALAPTGAIHPAPMGQPAPMGAWSGAATPAAGAAPMAAAPVQAAAAPPAAGGQGPGPACSKCGQPTTWVQEYSRYYCYRDNQYV